MDMRQPKENLLPEVEHLLSRLRGRIRFYIWTEGVAAVFVVLGAAFWIGLAIDWVFEPSPGLRAVALAAVALLAAWAVYRYILQRAFVRLGDMSMAVLLERRFGHFRDSLVTSVELAKTTGGSGDFNQEMLDHTGREAVEKSADVRLGKVFDPQPLVRKTSAAVVLAGSVVVFGVFASAAFGFWLERIALTDELWPRSTRLEVVGFAPSEQGIRSEKVARDADFELVIKADASRKDPPPSDVEIRYRLGDGRRGRAMATRVGLATAGRDDFQIYRHTFDGVTAPIEFDVVGGDDRINDLRLDVVDRPQFIEMMIDCRYPAYMQRETLRLAITGVMQIPEGSEVTILARTNKDLVETRVVDPLVSTPSVRSYDEESDDRRNFEHVILRVDEDRSLLLYLKDTDGIEVEEPYRLTILAVRDEVPDVGVQLKGIGTAIVPGARIPIVGTMTDDYAMERAWFEYQVDGGELQTIAFDSQPEGRSEISVEESLDTRAFDTENKLSAEQKLILSIKTTDRFDLGSEPHLGSSQRFLLDVVTPEQLRSILERRELTLRQRFQTVYNRMEETRDRLVRTDFGVPTGENADNRSGAGSDDPVLGDSAEPGDETESQRTFSPERIAARRRLRIVGALQNVEQASHETIGVGVAFEDIREELINNRIDSEELTSRLKDGISDPLKHVGEQLLPGLQKQIEQLRVDADNQTAGPAQLRQVPAQLRQVIVEADAVLVEMEQILGRMMELETYNEVVELLQGIIQDQGDLNLKTRDQRKKDIRGLLED